VLPHSETLFCVALSGYGFPQVIHRQVEAELHLISAYAALVAPFAEARTTLAIRLPDLVINVIPASATLPSKAFFAKW
jgi:hypothetical protein